VADISKTQGSHPFFSVAFHTNCYFKGNKCRKEIVVDSRLMKACSAASAAPVEVGRC
jgi:hypothetical protein